MPATIAVIDGVGGGIGAQIVERLRKEDLSGVSIVALGTNAVATQKMVNAGADQGASGENAIRVSINLADYIIGPIGIVLPNAMMGEITPAVAEAVFNSRGKKAASAQPAPLRDRRDQPEERGRLSATRYSR